MISKVLLTFLLSNITVGFMLNPKAALRMTARDTGSCDSRQTPGPICETCELLSTCVRHSSGWVNIPVEICDTQNGFYCNARLGICSNTTGPCHPFAVEGNFPCTSHGIFPDPYDCQRYHMCYMVGATLVSAPVECGADKAFSAATGQCSLSLNDRICQQKQFECTKAGEAHAWPSNTNIFYICKALLNQDERVLYPTLYRCADGEFFDGYYCRNQTGQSTSRPLYTLPTKRPGEPDYDDDGTVRQCPIAGLYADPDDCHRYYYCSVVNGTRRHIKCPNGTYFNRPFAACSLGQCTEDDVEK